MSTLTYSNTVTEEGVPVSRVVRAYSRTTKKLLASTTSNGEGFFTLSWTGTWELIFVVILDADGGVQYNALVRDLISPTET